MIILESNHRYLFPENYYHSCTKDLRYQVGSKESGIVIIPTELIPGNGDKLKDIVIKLAKSNKLEIEFLKWAKQ